MEVETSVVNDPQYMTVLSSLSSAINLEISLKNATAVVEHKIQFQLFPSLLACFLNMRAWQSIAWNVDKFREFVEFVTVQVVKDLLALNPSEVDNANFKRRLKRLFSGNKRDGTCPLEWLYNQKDSPIAFASISDYQWLKITADDSANADPSTMCETILRNGVRVVIVFLLPCSFR